MHPFIPSQLRGIRTQFGPSAIDEPEQPEPLPCMNRAPVRACQFATGPTTLEMARHAEAISQFHYRKRIGRNANERRAAR